MLQLSKSELNYFFFIHWRSFKPKPEVIYLFCTHFGLYILKELEKKGDKSDDEKEEEKEGKKADPDEEEVEGEEYDEELEEVKEGLDLTRNSNY